MILNINTWQRVKLLDVVGNVKGPAAVVRKAVKLLDLLEMSDADKEKVGVVKKESYMTWADKEHRWSIDVADGNLETFLRETVKGFDQWPANRDIVDLFDQLGIE